MNPFRKIIGFLIVALIGIPTLFGIIWAVGLTRAAVSPELISDLPQEVIDEVPYFIDDVYESLQKEDVTYDRWAREWIRASRKTGFSPRKFIDEIGLTDWLKIELSRSLQEIGEILRGDIPPRPIILDFRPLKRALKHPAVERVFLEILNELPSCDADQLEIWEHTARDEFFHDSLPPCRPADMELARRTLQNIHSEMVLDIPDEVDLFQGHQYFPKGISISKSVISLTYLLFFIPIIFIMGGALIAAHSKSSFFRWTGVSTLVGGLPALLLALLFRNIIPWVSNHVPASYSTHVSFDVQKVIFDNLGGVFNVVLDKLFSPVVAVAGSVCVIGVIFFAFSFAFTGEGNSKTHPVSEQKNGPGSSESGDNGKTG